MADFYFLDENSDAFPDPSRLPANDLVVVGSNLHPATLIKAYKKGYFPWYNEGEPRCWFHPDPRMILLPDELIVSRSMRPVVNGNRFTFKIDKNFLRVISYCRNARRWNGESKSWITDEIIHAYTSLFHAGYAHCAEAWQDGKLVGGLYGVRIGGVFFGESMFSTVSNASKFAFIKFVGYLKTKGVQLIDCQQQTSHMASLGARPVGRMVFVKYLQELIAENDTVS